MSLTINPRRAPRRPTPVLDATTAFRRFARHLRHAEGVGRVGKELGRLGGGTGVMHDSLDKVAERDTSNARRRGAIMDAAFNGIGEGDDRWWS